MKIIPFNAPMFYLQNSSWILGNSGYQNSGESHPLSQFIFIWTILQWLLLQYVHPFAKNIKQGLKPEHPGIVTIKIVFPFRSSAAHCYIVTQVDCYRWQPDASRMFIRGWNPDQSQFNLCFDIASDRICPNLQETMAVVQIISSPSTV